MTLLLILLHSLEGVKLAEMKNYWIPCITRKATKDLTLVAIVLWIKVLPEYLYQ